jgi:hypothetical protein
MGAMEIEIGPRAGMDAGMGVAKCRERRAAGTANRGLATDLVEHAGRIARPVKAEAPSGAATKASGIAVGATGLEGMDRRYNSGVSAGWIKCGM